MKRRKVRSKSRLINHERDRSSIPGGVARKRNFSSGTDDAHHIWWTHGS